MGGMSAIKKWNWRIYSEENRCAGDSRLKKLWTSVMQSSIPTSSFRWTEPMTIPHYQPAQSRRDFLARAGGGFGSLALASLLTRDAAAASSSEKPTSTVHAPHF